jgi:hypothetical protein
VVLKLRGAGRWSKDGKRCGERCDGGGMSDDEDNEETDNGKREILKERWRNREDEDEEGRQHDHQ